MSTLAAFRSPTSAAPPTTVLRQDVGTAAWFALLRDGVVRPLWHDVALRADLVESPDLRAAALARVVPRRAVVGRASAAWVHVGGLPPARVELLFAPGRRRTDPHPLRLAVETRLAADDVVQVGPIRVTSVQRTGLDVARSAPPVAAARTLSALAGQGFDARRALDELARLGPVRDVRRARAVLRDCAALPADPDDTTG